MEAIIERTVAVQNGNAVWLQGVIDNALLIGVIFDSVVIGQMVVKNVGYQSYIWANHLCALRRSLGVANTQFVNRIVNGGWGLR